MFDQTDEVIKLQVGPLEKFCTFNLLAAFTGACRKQRAGRAGSNLKNI
jgi:hypothetical protein